MIKEATLSQAIDAAQLALLLWPENSLEEFIQNMKVVIRDENSTVFLDYEEDQAIGFAQCQLRHDYVEGTDSSPVGYLEGLYVVDQYREKGIAKGLVQACENWAKEKGCTEFASDCELTNMQSLEVHLQLKMK